jgi:hypothetical protein
MLHHGSEVSKTDLDPLDTLDLLHEVANTLSEGSVVRSVNSFPLPRDLNGQTYMIPNYLLIEPPFVMGEIQEFDPEIISFNIELGETIARWTKVDFLDRMPTRFDADGRTPIPTQRREASDESWLEQQKRSAVMGLIRSRIDTWRARERNPNDTAGIWRRQYEALQAKVNNIQFRPPRRSHRAVVG